MPCHSRKFFFFFPLLLSSYAFSQKVNIEGQFLDATDNSPIIGVGVMLVKEGDSTTAIGAVTDLEGSFTLRAVPGNYRLKATYIGYKNYAASITLVSEPVKLAIIKLDPQAVQLKDVVVEGRMIRSIQKGDTTEYNANAFKTNPDATVQDLITKMPGITIENGTVKAQGETIQKVTVDGKEFFGDDASMALKNLPAEVVDKIQVYNRLSDQAQFTGVDDGSAQKSLNIVTKAGRNNGQFGKVFAGYGTNERYQVGGNLNIFRGQRRISILGLSNNVNQQNFASQDLLGVSGGNSGRGNMGGRSGSGGGSLGSGFGGSGGNPANNFLVGQQSGINTTQSFGLNYSDAWGKKLTLTGSYFFNKTINNTANSLNREYFLAGRENQFFDQNSNSGSQNINHRANLRIEYKIDSSNSFLLTPRLSFQNTTSNSIQNASTRLLDSLLLNQTSNQNSAATNGYTLVGNLLYRHKFAKRKRTLSADIGTSMNNKTGLAKLTAQNVFYNLTTFDSSTYLDQRTNTQGSGYTLSSNLLYTEPIGKRSALHLSYTPSYSQNQSERLTEKRTGAGDTYSVLDSALSSRYDNPVLTQKAGVRYIFNHLKYNFITGVEGQQVDLRGQQEFPVAFKTNRSFQNVLPNAMFYYKVNKTSNVRVMYRTQTDVPSVNQLQSVVNNTNPLQLSTGNPNLKQEYSHQISARFRFTNAEKARSFYSFLSGTYTQNYIGSSSLIALRPTVIDNRLVLNEGAQLTRPVNLEGYLTASAFATYGLPIDFLKSNLNINAGSSYSRTPSLINNVLNYANTYTENIGFVIGSNISEKIDFTITSTGFYNIVKNSIRPQLNNNYYNQLSAVKVNFMPWKGWVLNSEWNHTLYSGLGAGYDVNFVLWNAGLGYKFLQNQTGELRMTVFDLLNQNKSVVRNVTGSYVENSRTQVLTRYFMFTFTYNLRNFTPPKEDKEGRLPRPDSERGLSPYGPLPSH